MALGTFIAGAYVGTYNSIALGITDEGYMLQWEPQQQNIEKSDVFGDQIIDTVYRGTRWFLQTEFLEWKAGPQDAAYRWSNLGLQGTIGRLGSDVAAALVLTSTAGTPAVATPATLTAAKALLAPGSNPQAQFDSRLRTIPVRMIMFPYSNASTITNFLLT